MSNRHAQLSQQTQSHTTTTVEQMSFVQTIKSEMNSQVNDYTQ